MAVVAVGQPGDQERHVHRPEDLLDDDQAACLVGGRRDLAQPGGGQDGERYIQYEQDNVEAMRLFCKERREFYQKYGTDNPFFAGTFHAMDLPKCFAHEISSKWFNNRPWELIKQEKKDKILFYAIVNEYYSDFVCHPSGKIPLPYNPAIPTK